MTYSEPVSDAAFIAVVETPDFIMDAKGLMSDAQRHLLINHLAANLMEGVLIKGTGGARKMRWALPGKGKSGGCRAVYFYHDDTIPVFALNVFAKSDKINLTAAERNELKKILSELVDAYRKGVRRNVEGRQETP